MASIIQKTAPAGLVQVPEEVKICSSIVKAISSPKNPKPPNLDNPNGL
jgi:hypothetical protein